MAQMPGEWTKKSLYTYILSYVHTKMNGIVHSIGYLYVYKDITVVVSTFYVTESSSYVV